MAHSVSLVDYLCDTCSRLDFRSLFQYSLQGPPLRKWEKAKNRPEPLFLGILSEIAAKTHCPFCRLVRHCALLNHASSINPGFRLQPSGEEVPCYLDTFTADWNRYDLAEPADAGPPAWYMGFLLGNLS